MDLKNNQILIKYIKGLLSSNEFMRIAREKGDCANDYIVSVLNYSIATREVPDEKFYTNLRIAQDTKDYENITANLIYDKLAEKIVANGFNPKPVSVYRDFANNFYRYGLLFSGKKQVKHTVNFPADFLELVYEQPNNAVVKAYRYLKNTGRFTYFAPCPQTALQFASNLSGFWGAMLNYKQVDTKKLPELKAELYEQVDGLNISGSKKSKLYKEIIKSLDEYASTGNIKMLITDRDYAYEWQACRMNGTDYNQRYGEIEPYADFYDVKQKYKISGANDKDIVLAEIKNLYSPMTLHCKEVTPRAERVSAVAEFNLSNRSKEEALAKNGL